MKRVKTIRRLTPNLLSLNQVLIQRKTLILEEKAILPMKSLHLMYQILGNYTIQLKKLLLIVYKVFIVSITNANS